VCKGYSDAPAAVLLQRSPPLIVGGDAFTYSKFDGCLTSAVKIVSSVCDELSLLLLENTTGTANEPRT